MLAEDEGKERQLQRMGLALDQAEAVVADVGVLRRVRDEALVGQPRGEVVVVRAIDGRIGHVARASLEAMLADDHGPAFAGVEILRHEQNPVREDVRARRPASPRSRGISGVNSSRVRGLRQRGSGKRPITSFQMWLRNGATSCSSARATTRRRATRMRRALRRAADHGLRVGDQLSNCR